MKNQPLKMAQTEEITVTFTTEKSALTRLFSPNKERKFYLSTLAIGTLDQLINLPGFMTLHTEAEDTTSLKWKYALIVATAILKKPLQINLFAPFLGLYLYQKLDSDTLSKLARVVYSLSGVQSLPYLMNINAILAAQ